MSRFTLRFAAAACLAIATTPAVAADPDLLPLGKAGDFTLSAPTVDEEHPSGWYLRADGGYIIPRASSLDMGPVSFEADLGDSGWTLGAGLGYRFANWLRVDLSADYADLGRISAGPGLSVTGTSFLATGYWDIATFSGFTPYVGAGIGFGVVNLDAGNGPASTQWGLAWSLSAGASYALAGNVSVDLGYRYVNFGDADVTGAAVPTTLNGVAAHEIRLGLRYGLR